MAKVIISIFFSLIFATINGQVKTDSTYRLPVNEKLHYKINYKLGSIWINAGMANLKSDTLSVDSSRLYHFSAEGYSLEKYKWVYRLEDHYTSLTNYNTLAPVRFTKENTEKGIWVHNIYNFYPKEKKIDLFMEATRQQPVHRTEKFEGFITDALSALYYIRTIDFNSYSIGDTLVFKSILDGKIFNQSLVYLGKDEIKTTDGQPVKSFKLNAVIENSTFFRGDDAVVFWITDNEERWLAKAKAKIVIGSIIIYLDKQGLISFGPEK